MTNEKSQLTEAPSQSHVWPDHSRDVIAGMETEIKRLRDVVVKIGREADFGWGTSGANDALKRIQVLAKEFPDEPTPELPKDKLGWICLVCGYWNHPGNQICEHRDRPQHQQMRAAVKSSEPTAKCLVAGCPNPPMQAAFCEEHNRRIPPDYSPQKSSGESNGN